MKTRRSRFFQTSNPEIAVDRIDPLLFSRVSRQNTYLVVSLTGSWLIFVTTLALGLHEVFSKKKVLPVYGEVDGTIKQRLSGER